MMMLWVSDYTLRTPSILVPSAWLNRTCWLRSRVEVFLGEGSDEAIFEDSVNRLNSCRNRYAWQWLILYCSVSWGVLQCGIGRVEGDGAHVRGISEHEFGLKIVNYGFEQAWTGLTRQANSANKQHTSAAILSCYSNLIDLYFLRHSETQTLPFSVQNRPKFHFSSSAARSYSRLGLYPLWH
jgi:hypothetical protein